MLKLCACVSYFINIYIILHNSFKALCSTDWIEKFHGTSPPSCSRRVCSDVCVPMKDILLATLPSHKIEISPRQLRLLISSKQ